MRFKRFMRHPSQSGEETPREGVLRLLRQETTAHQAQLLGGDFTFIDLFAGIGGLRLAMQQACARNTAPPAELRR